MKVGDTRTEVVLDNISRTRIVIYAGASGDYKPLHSDEVFTTQVADYTVATVNQDGKPVVTRSATAILDP